MFLPQEFVTPLNISVLVGDNTQQGRKYDQTGYMHGVEDPSLALRMTNSKISAGCHAEALEA